MSYPKRILALRNFYSLVFSQLLFINGVFTGEAMLNYLGFCVGRAYSPYLVSPRWIRL